MKKAVTIFLLTLVIVCSVPVKSFAKPISNTIEISIVVDEESNKAEIVNDLQVAVNFIILYKLFF